MDYCHTFGCLTQVRTRFWDYLFKTDKTYSDFGYNLNMNNASACNKYLLEFDCGYCSVKQTKVFPLLYKSLIY